jgi:predicted alpha/beta hydrolase
MREPEGFSRLSTLGPAPLTLTCDDDFCLDATCFEAAGTPRAIVVVAGALGVHRRFYARFAEFMAAQGVAALTFDYRGLGGSVPGEGQAELIDMAAWGAMDIDAAIRSAAALYPGAPIFLIGHSCGGQLVALAPSTKQLAGVILVSATLPHRSRYPRPDRYMLWLMWRVLLPLATLGKGHVATGVPGMSGATAPRAVWRQWARWCRSRDYLFDPRFELNTTPASTMTAPLLSIAITDDDRAPPEAITPLLERFTASHVERRVVDARQVGFGSIGHLGFFRSKMRDALWFPVLSWMLRQRARDEAA